MQKVLVSQVVTHLLEPKVAAKVLSSPSHVCWAMETCGQGFSLPIEEEESITKVISFYRMLALEPSRRPCSIDGNPQFFLQVSGFLLPCSGTFMWGVKRNLFFPLF